MYQLNNVPNNIIELSHSKLSDNAVLSIARRIAMFKNNDALEPTHHICSLIAEASVRLTAVTDVTTAVSSIRIQLTLPLFRKWDTVVLCFSLKSLVLTTLPLYPSIKTEWTMASMCSR